MITVIIPIYNVEKYIKKCLDSVLNQTYKDLEIIIVNDGSTDSTLEIVQDYAKKDSRIILINKINEGQGIARNIALDCAKGDYIAFVDGDDYLLPNMYEEMLESAKNYDADIVISGVIFDYGFCRKTYNKIKELKVFNSNRDLLYEYFVERSIYSAPWNKLYRSNLWKEIRFPNLRAREDAYLLPAIYAMCNKGVFLPKSYYVQFVRQNSTENSKFNLNKLAIIDSAEKSQAIVAKYIEKDYIIVEALLLETYVSLMAEILFSFSYKKFKYLYFELLEKAKREQIELTKSKNSKKLNLERFKKALKNSFSFRFKWRLKGIKSKIKFAMMGMYLSMKGKQH